jgi:tetratricopeptide (TPR) repeat protein
MAGPLSKAPPPRPTAEKRAQRRKQRRMVWTALAALFLAVVAWQIYEYVDSASERAQLQLPAAISLLTPGRYEEAVVKLTEVINADPGSWNAYLQRGIANQNLGALDKAVDDFHKALLLNPNLSQAHTELAEIYRRKGDPKSALQELNKVIEAAPTMDAYSTRALVHAELEQHDEAVADFTWVINKARDAPFAFYARAKSKRAMGDEAGAAEDERAAAALDRGRVH